MKSLIENLNYLHFRASRFKLASKTQSGLCCLCCLKGIQTFAPTRIVVKTRTRRGAWPDRYLCSICATEVAQVHLGVKKSLVGKIAVEKLAGVELSEAETAIIRQLSNGKPLTAGQLKVEIGASAERLSTPEVREICQRLCECNLLQRNQCDRYSRYSLAEELAHAS